MGISSPIREPQCEPPRVYPVNCQAQKHSPDTQEQISIDHGWLLSDLVEEIRDEPIFVNGLLQNRGSWIDRL